MTSLKIIKKEGFTVLFSLFIRKFADANAPVCKACKACKAGTFAAYNGTCFAVG